MFAFLESICLIANVFAVKKNAARGYKQEANSYFLFCGTICYLNDHVLHLFPLLIIKLWATYPCNVLWDISLSPFSLSPPESLDAQEIVILWEKTDMPAPLTAQSSDSDGQ